MCISATVCLPIAHDLYNALPEIEEAELELYSEGDDAGGLPAVLVSQFCDISVVVFSLDNSVLVYYSFNIQRVDYR